jgi:uncharacterized DUF497 family protein
MLYEWNEDKNISNQKNHGIAFEEAVTVFDQSDYLLYEDEKPASEQRFIAIGHSKKGNHLLVVHCYRVRENDEERTRIISARKVTKAEEKSLEGL